MNILFVIDTFYTSNNGTSISAQRYAAELRKRGHLVRILCGDKPKKDQQANLSDGDYCTGIFHFPIFQFMCEKHDFFYGNADKALIREACDWAEVVHVYTPFFLGNAAITYCKQTGKPVTAAFHVQPENITSSFGMGKVGWANNLIYRIFRRVTYSRVRHIHTPSRFIANELRQHGYTAQMHVISNGIHEEFITAGTQKISQQNNPTGEAGLTSNSPKDVLSDEASLINILMIGRLSREKRQDVIIRAMQYSKYADRIQLVFAGKGPERRRYERLARHLTRQPLFVYEQRPDLIRRLLHTDLYIHASDMEIEAISCIEAFATGLVPVIANSAESATPQFALDRRSLFKAGDPRDLARAIDYWLDHPDERHAMEQRYAAAAQRYSLARSVMIFEQMLRQEIADNRRTPDETTTPTQHITLLSAIKRQAVRLYRHIA